VLVLLLLAKLSGERSVSGIAQWVRLRQGWLEQTLGLQQFPCANTYHYILRHVDYAALVQHLREWFAANAPSLYGILCVRV
jgi:hypothetical protein